uniref:Uncharacterized protein n=1 Tax=Desertifilum tharense IPPAS B-1220 TaxID=1781255 RepID=A0A1E5QGI8_9CYAN|nr:hypothetical protein BH720_17885 [Desertifilum tharense IPPAS B-1220]
MILLERDSSLPRPRYHERGILNVLSVATSGFEPCVFLSQQVFEEIEPAPKGRFILLHGIGDRAFRVLAFDGWKVG